jgi:tRNA1(Val) A37 N6-methylase TrmN6
MSCGLIPPMQADPATFETTEDALLGGKLMLRQPARGHRAGHDAILLAAATDVRSGETIADLGAGAGQAGLALAVRARHAGIDDLRLLLIERDTHLAQLAAGNAEKNGIAARAVTLDLGASAAAFLENGIAADSVDRVLTNPPFNDAARHRASQNALRSAAHIAADDTLEVFVHAARRMLKPQGCLTLIWRADGLAEVLQALSRGFGSIAVTPVYPREGEAAIRVLIKAEKGGRRPFELRPGLVLHEASGQPTPHVDAVLRGEAALVNA